MNRLQNKSWLFFGALLALSLGVLLRLWQITVNQFLFYDEGMYLGYNHDFLRMVANNPPKDLNEFFIILGFMFKISLTTAKALWFFLLNLRVFGFGLDAFFFARLISAIAGIGTIVMVYFFAKRYFQSQRVAVLSAVFLSLLPSHVFYSRLGMQESLSTLLFFAAIYIYVLCKQKWAPVLCAFLLACVFLTNYRMIIAPIFIAAIEVFEMLKTRRGINWQKALITTGAFALIVFVVGSLYGGVNRHVTFGWMFHQAQEAKSERNLISLFSYPYYTFVLEGVFFALIFWSNLFLVFKKQYAKLLPFLLVLLQMGIFSLAAEKGARYLCVVLPFMAIAAAVAANSLLDLDKYKKHLLMFIAAACVLMAFHSFRLMIATTSYKKAVDLIMEHDPQAKIISTQALVEGLYVPDEKMVQECPKSLVDLVKFYKEGYRYLIVDPQVYISWTKSGERFDPPLIDFMELIDQKAQPIAVFDHLDPVLLNRFVLDHNQNLVYSVGFLSHASSQGYGKINIYDLTQCLELLKNQAIQAASSQQ